LPVGASPTLLVPSTPVFSRQPERQQMLAMVEAEHRKVVELVKAEQEKMINLVEAAYERNKQLD
jgi:hypothetical protein